MIRTVVQDGPILLALITQFAMMQQDSTGILVMVIFHTTSLLIITWYCATVIQVLARALL